MQIFRWTMVKFTYDIFARKITTEMARFFRTVYSRTIEKYCWHILFFQVESWIFRQCSLNKHRFVFRNVSWNPLNLIRSNDVNFNSYFDQMNYDPPFRVVSELSMRWEMIYRSCAKTFFYFYYVNRKWHFGKI